MRYWYIHYGTSAFLGLVLVWYCHEPFVGLGSESEDEWEMGWIYWLYNDSFVKVRRARGHS